MERDGFRAKKSLKRSVLRRDFYERGAIEVARDLLGQVLVHGPVAGIIVETEAYLGGDDLASHSAVGITDRTRHLRSRRPRLRLSFLRHARLLQHSGGVARLSRLCADSCALEPVEGLDIMRSRRPKARSDRDLASGPGKLTQAMGITRKDTGVDMTRGDLVVLARRAASFEIAVTLRIGITKCAELPLRFSSTAIDSLSRSK